jgi:uroporphyrin-III C-methyltransferase
VVPGVSSGIAAPAAAGIPVTLRGVSASVTFATAHLELGEPEWKHLAAAPTLVLFMAGSRLARVCEALVNAGRSPSTPAAIVIAGTWTHQEVIEGDLQSLSLRSGERGRGEGPTLLIIGDVVKARRALLQPEPELARGVS